MAFIQQFTKIAFDLYGFLLLVYIVSSWLGGLPRNSFGYFIRDILKPLLQIVRKIPHRIGPIDISVIYAIFALEIIRTVVLSLLISLT